VSPRRRAEGVLLLTTAVWGTTFVAVKEALTAWPPFGLMAVRFGLAALAFLPALLRPGALDRKTLGRGAFLGVLIYLGFSLQTLGLGRTSEARSAFFTALSTILVPILGWSFLRREPVAGTLAAMAFGIGGISCLFGVPLEEGVRDGDLLTVGCAVVFAVQILVLGEFLRDSPVLPLTGVELVTTALLSLASGLVEGKPLPPVTGGNVALLLYLGLLATAVTLWGQVYGQRSTTANRAAFLFALEPVFAVYFAWLVRSRAPSTLEWAGGALIVVAAIVADRPLPARLRRISREASG
jgi:drug/metabolite transporter (DMT)-like permease